MRVERIVWILAVLVAVAVVFVAVVTHRVDAVKLVEEERVVVATWTYSITASLCPSGQEEGA